MCDIKKLCICDEVGLGKDHWKLECHYGRWPSWDQLVETRPEHRKLAEGAKVRGKDIMGPLPMPLFKELHRGIAAREHLTHVVAAEEDWLNEGNQFDFEYEPFEGDRLMFFIGGEKIAFSFQKGRWHHKPHQAYSVDYRCGINAEKEDREARQRAAAHIQAQYPTNS
jgi:hypothetical protein